MKSDVVHLIVGGWAFLLLVAMFLLEIICIAPALAAECLKIFAEPWLASLSLLNAASPCQAHLTVLRILRYAIVVLVDRHAANVIVSGEERALSFFCSPMCKQRWAQESTTGACLAFLLDVARREEDLPSACLSCHDAMQWSDDVFHARRRNVFIL